VDERHLCLVEEQLLLEEVAARLGCERNLWQADDFYAFAFSLDDERFYLLHVVLRVGNLDRRDGRSHLYESMVHDLRFLVFLMFSTAKLQRIINNKKLKIKN